MSHRHLVRPSKKARRVAAVAAGLTIAVFTGCTPATGPGKGDSTASPDPSAPRQGPALVDDPIGDTVDQAGDPVQIDGADLLSFRYELGTLLQGEDVIDNSELLLTEAGAEPGEGTGEGVVEAVNITWHTADLQYPDNEEVPTFAATMVDDTDELRFTMSHSEGGLRLYDVTVTNRACPAAAWRWDLDADEFTLSLPVTCFGGVSRLSMTPMVSVATAAAPSVNTGVDVGEPGGALDLTDGLIYPVTPAPTPAPTSGPSGGGTDESAGADTTGSPTSGENS